MFHLFNSTLSSYAHPHNDYYVGNISDTKKANLEAKCFFNSRMQRNRQNRKSSIDYEQNKEVSGIDYNYDLLGI